MASRTAYSTWTPQKSTLFDGHYLRNRSTLDIGVLGYIGIVLHKEHSPEVLSIPPGTPYIIECISRIIKVILTEFSVCNSYLICLLVYSLRQLWESPSVCTNVAHRNLMDGGVTLANGFPSLSTDVMN